MTRPELEHVIRAAAGTANVLDIVVIGSQAILGAYPDAPEELTESIEANVFPKDAPDRSIVIDGAIGELSLFNSTLGYGDYLRAPGDCGRHSKCFQMEPTSHRSVPRPVHPLWLRPPRHTEAMPGMWNSDFDEK